MTLEFIDRINMFWFVLHIVVICWGRLSRLQWHSSPCIGTNTTSLRRIHLSHDFWSYAQVRTFVFFCGGNSRGYLYLNRFFRYSLLWVRKTILVLLSHKTTRLGIPFSRLEECLWYFFSKHIYAKWGLPKLKKYVTTRARARVYVCIRCSSFHVLVALSTSLIVYF